MDTPAAPNRVLDRVAALTDEIRRQGTAKRVDWDTIAWLASQGIRDQKPSIRSGDFRLVLECPFRYLLSRRFGITPGLQWTEALNRGSWFHLMAEHDPMDTPTADTNATREVMSRLLDMRLAELRTICEEQDLDRDTTQRILQRERQDALTVIAWYHASSEVPLRHVTLSSGADVTGGWRQYLSDPRWIHLGRELEVSVQTPFKEVTAAGRFDRLLLASDSRTVWILDIKTTSLPAWERAASTPLEYQTLHYLWILSQIMQSPPLRDEIGIPHDADIGGMIHLIVRKPPIRFGSRDRPYIESDTIIKRGPRKGARRVQREYLSTEPDLGLYLRRCRDWYLARGEYQRLADDHNHEPVAISFSPAEYALVRTGRLRQYWTAFRHVLHWRSEQPDPALFPRSESSPKNPWDPFYRQPVSDWPLIIKSDYRIRTVD